METSLTRTEMAERLRALADAQIDDDAATLLRDAAQQLEDDQDAVWESWGPDN